MLTWNQISSALARRYDTCNDFLITKSIKKKLGILNEAGK
jgi:hypothetical protein